jgi:hypothetical protein
MIKKLICHIHVGKHVTFSNHQVINHFYLTFLVVVVEEEREGEEEEKLSIWRKSAFFGGFRLSAMIDAKDGQI